MTQAVAAPVTGAESVVWDLSPLYSGTDDPKIAADIARALQMADEYAAHWRGRVASLTGAQVMEAIHEYEALYDVFGGLYSFASMYFSIDTSDPARGGLLQKMGETYARLEQKTMFFDLEWKALDDDAAGALLAQIEVPRYRHALESQRRYKPFTLTEPEEQIIVEKDVTGSSAWVRFYDQLTSAWRFTLKNADGSDDPTPYTQAQIFAKLQDIDRDVRRRAAAAVTATLSKDTMPTTYIFNTLMADKAAEDARRGFATWISSRNMANKAEDSTVDALVQAVTSRYDICQRHYRLKRILLGYDELYDYDRYAPLAFNGQDKFYVWDEARRIVESAYQRFSPTAGDVVRRFFDEKWIHAPSQPGKRGGAYASPTVPSKHPYVFMNFVGKAGDVMTLAHELGHGLHMYLGGKANGMQGLYTPLTTAEMASTFGEMLTFDDLMAAEDDPRTRLEMLFEKTEDSFGTIFRQIAMNRFEHAMHTARREGDELTTEQFSTLWMETQRAQFGDSVTLRDDYSLWWSYIPHFLHTPGYVYAYSFGELLVLALFSLYKQQGADFADRYIGVLEAGNTDYPVNILAQVGVNLDDPAFWHHGLDILSAMVDQEEALAREIFPEKFA